MGILYTLIIGAISGWLAGLLVKGYGYGLLWNIIIGIAGAFIGGWLLGELGVKVNLGTPTVNLIVTSVVGAAVLLLIAGLFRGRR
jgi:uncharacterized membrane protein YeaQ/YmgE (transglycosylase-associated protein family)